MACLEKAEARVKRLLRGLDLNAKDNRPSGQV
jgi:hypothetical protein